MIQYEPTTNESIGLIRAARGLHIYLGSTLTKTYQVSGSPIIGYAFVYCMLAHARGFARVIKLYVRLICFNT